MRQIPPEDLARIIKMEKIREKAVYNEKHTFMDHHYERLWTIHKKPVLLDEMRLYQQQAQEIIAGLEIEHKENPTPFKFAVKLNEPLKLARIDYIDKFKWLLTTIEKEIKNIETKENNF